MYSKSLLISFLAAFGAAEVHNVNVGGKGFTFDPQTLTVKTGDIVIFQLSSPHDVVSSSIDKPCQQATNGFYSGPFSGTDSGNKKFVVNVTSADPVYYYCSVPTHCQGGMVGGWNLPSSGNTIDAYTSKAKGTSSSETPGSMSGGQLLDDSQIASITASSGSTTPTASGSSGSQTKTSSGSGSQTTASSGSGSQTTASSSSGSQAGAYPTGAADSIVTGQNGILALAMGFVAWLL